MHNYLRPEFALSLTLECCLSLHGISSKQELKSSFDLEAYEYLRGAGLLTHMVYLKMSQAPA
jgi:hypothetical protein